MNSIKISILFIIFSILSIPIFKAISISNDFIILAFFIIISLVTGIFFCLIQLLVVNKNIQLLLDNKNQLKIRKVSLEILKTFKEDEVLINTPIAYYKSFKELKELL